MEDLEERFIDVINPKASRLITFPYNIRQSSKKTNKVTLHISIQASVEGYPNQNLADIQRTITVSPMEKVIGRSVIPCLFRAGNPLTPENAELFGDRQDLIKVIQDSFFEGKQRRIFF